MAFFRAGYSVKYASIIINKSVRDSHLNTVKDGIRFLLIIFKVATLHSPLKVFLPIALSFFRLAAVHYLNTHTGEGRFTNLCAFIYNVGIYDDANF
jgi:hypothetical protein